jgi:hypothetical protein
MNRSFLFSTLLALCPLAACDGPVSPDLDAVTAIAPAPGNGEAPMLGSDDRSSEDIRAAPICVHSDRLAEAFVACGGSAPPVLTTFLNDDGAEGALAFRSSHGVAISDTAPLRLVIGHERFRAPLTAGPARFTDPDGTVVDQASYQFSIQMYRALIGSPISSVSVEVHDGTAYIAYPYVSGDFIELSKAF